MEVNSALNGLKVLVTRPKHQAKSLCEMVTDSGGEAIAFPTIDIVPTESELPASFQLDEQDIIIFVSHNSVRFFGENLQSMLSKNILPMAIGASTAQFMQDNGFQTVLQPPAPAGSESLLAMAALHDVAGKNVLIVRGQDGRELLAETLKQRGAKTHYLEMYQRALPTPSPDEVEQALLAECIIISSVNSLVNLCQLIGEENIKNKHLIVVSNRIKQYAIDHGFEHIDVAEDASDRAVMQQIYKGGAEYNGK